MQRGGGARRSGSSETGVVDELEKKKIHEVYLNGHEIFRLMLQCCAEYTTRTTGHYNVLREYYVVLYIYPCRIHSSRHYRLLSPKIDTTGSYRPDG